MYQILVNRKVVIFLGRKNEFEKEEDAVQVVTGLIVSDANNHSRGHKYNYAIQNRTTGAIRDICSGSLTLEFSRFSVSEGVTQKYL